MAQVAIGLAVSGAMMGLQYLLTPRVKQEPIDKGKLDDIRITGSEYGAFIPRGWGKFRVGGNLVFSSGVNHQIINTPSGGGKGVPQAPATRTHVYTTTIAVLICRGEVVNFLRAWADADLILGNGEVSNGTFEAEDATLSGGASVVTDAGASGGEYVGSLGSGGKATFDFSAISDPTAPPADPDQLAIAYTRINFFYKCAADRTATVTTDVAGAETVSFTATGSDWTVKTIQVVGFADSLEFANAGSSAPDLDVITIEKYWFIQPLETLGSKFVPTYKVTGKVNQNIVYPLDLNDPSEYYNAPITADVNGKVAITTSIPSEAVRYYKGTATQTQDSALTAYFDSLYGSGEGVLRTPAFRRQAYVVFENRQLRQARVENFTFEIDMGTADCEEILSDLCDDVGISSSDYDFSDVSGADYTPYGFVEHTKQSRRALAEYLERYYLFRLAQIDGVLKAVPFSVSSLATIDADLLRAHHESEEMPAFDGELAIKEEHLKPREVRVSVLNPDLEYRNEAVTAQLFGSLAATESVEYAFPIVDRPTTARLQAEKLILKDHAEDQAVRFSGMPELAKYAVGDVITVPLDGENVTIRIEKKQMALPLGKIEFSGVKVTGLNTTYYQDAFTTLAPKAQQLYSAFNFPRNSVVIPIISKPLTSAHRGRYGVYLAVCGRGRGSAENIAVYREFDTDNYVLQFIADTPSIVGLCEDTLGTHGDETVEDTTNTLDIWFFDDIELESVTAPDIARYATLNLLRVGDEWIQFRTATAQTLEDNSPYRSKWRVSNLMRGRFGTEGVMSGHVADEYATLYTSAVRWFDLDTADVGETITLKAVTNGQSEENGQIASFSYDKVAGEYTVTNLTGDRSFDANNTSLNELADVVGTLIDDLNY